MLIYNVSYHLSEKQEKSFLIWLQEVYINTVSKEKLLKNPCILKILSHQQDGDISYAVQWEVESSAVLHQWHMKQGNFLSDEISKIFGKDVMFFETLMREVDQ